MARSPTPSKRQAPRATAKTAKSAKTAKTAAAARTAKPGKTAKVVETDGNAAADALEKYRQMRDFGTTSEPSGKPTARKTTARAKRSAPALSFVIQKHAARRLHYDFRLELDGTLKSWAIPKGPSLDPADKRMGVHVEDHPLEYGSFEGVIPEKQYGAGTVIVWDRGTWVPTEDPHEGYRNGKLKFELQGEKLHGGWTLVKMKNRSDARQEPWLLIKERDDWARPAAEFDITEALPNSVLSGVVKADKRARKDTVEPAKNKAAKASRAAVADDDMVLEAATGEDKATAKRGGRTRGAAAPALPDGARPAPLPLTLSPQLATLVTDPPVHAEQWIYEVKFDGYRILARIDGGKVTLFTRNGHDWTAKLKTLAQQVAALGLPSGWLDGEIVVVGEDGNTDFQALQNAFDSARTDTIQYFVFDLPFYAGHDLRKVPLVERRALLRRLFQSDTAPRRVRFSESFEVGAGEILSAACRLRLEGVIGKRVDAPYVSRRSDSWIKLKCSERQEFVIGGFTEPQGSRTGIGALLLGIHDEQGRLVYAGKVGTGFDTATLDDIRKKLDAVRADAAPFHRVPTGVKGLWVRPKLVAEVSFGAWTKDGLIRHSVFHGLRTDKSAGAIGREKAVPPPDDEDAAPPPRGKKSASGAAAAAGKAAGTAGKTGAAARTQAPSRRPGSAAGGTIGGIKVSHADRVIDPSTGLTKGDLVRYYEAVGPAMLPHLAGRPVALVRGPSGVGGELFFQKHGDTLRMPGIKQLDPSLWPEHPPMLEVASETGLVAAAQLNVIEFHTWNADKRSIEKPDRIVFDLDPGEGVPWEHVKEAAALTRAMLEELGLIAFLKTSGGKGLHVVVPLQRKLEWDEVKAFSQDVVVHMARTIPQRFVAKSGPRNRVGKIFIDYLRNGRGATTAAAFSARARPGLGVSIPVHWEELKTLRSGAQWTIIDAIARVDEMARDDPWADYATTRQTLTTAIKRIRAD
jgi:bifunctional non-homologous end joining protein LigD